MVALETLGSCLAGFPFLISIVRASSGLSVSSVIVSSLTAEGGKEGEVIVKVSSGVEVRIREEKRSGEERRREEKR